MSFEIIATPSFRRDIKALAKKYPSLKNEFAQLVSNLEINPQQQGTSLGNDCTKYALRSRQKEKVNQAVRE